MAVNVVLEESINRFIDAQLPLPLKSILLFIANVPHPDPFEQNYPKGNYEFPKLFVIDPSVYRFDSGY